MHLFMNSRMIEAENICLRAADHRLYFSVGYSLIQCIKSLMTFEPEDLEAAVSCCKDSLVITQHLRKSSGAIASVGKLVTGTTNVSAMKGMTTVQRHAELVNAECVLLKAIIGIIYSFFFSPFSGRELDLNESVRVRKGGDFIAFLKEAINLRNSYACYRCACRFSFHLRNVAADDITMTKRRE